MDKSTFNTLKLHSNRFSRLIPIQFIQKRRLSRLLKSTKISSKNTSAIIKFLNANWFFSTFLLKWENHLFLDHSLKTSEICVKKLENFPLFTGWTVRINRKFFTVNVILFSLLWRHREHSLLRMNYRSEQVNLAAHNKQKNITNSELLILHSTKKVAHLTLN